MRIVWCITGAGHLLRESFQIMRELKEEKDVKITTLISKAGEEVIKMYGLFGELNYISGGGYYEEIVLEREHPYSSPITGRLSLGKYDYLISSPTTGNTVAKVVRGIADTLITNAIAQAGKGFVRSLIVPVDYEAGVVITKLPYSIDKKKCICCLKCVEACPNGAIILRGKFPEIVLSKCLGCGECKRACPNGAIIEGKEIKMRVRKVDAENTKRLMELEDVVVLKHPKEILEYLL
ncbi:MAG: dihydromethanopterin reductase (acceptor) [Methanococci archaeon]|nr:dihydromethanopterin reductase (acceptor) [Methanococci archaeon]